MRLLQRKRLTVVSAANLLSPQVFFILTPCRLSRLIKAIERAGEVLPRRHNQFCIHLYLAIIISDTTGSLCTEYDISPFALLFFVAVGQFVFRPSTNRREKMKPSTTAITFQIMNPSTTWFHDQILAIMQSWSRSSLLHLSIFVAD